jgi:GABA permease
VRASFVGSGVVIGSAFAAVISFAITGMLVVLVMRMLAMAVATPGVGWIL